MPSISGYVRRMRDRRGMETLIRVKKLSLTITPALMTDNTNTTGYIDFPTNSLPANCFVLGWSCKATAGFAGDTTATIQVGIAGTLDFYSAITTGSIFAAGKVGAIVKTNHPHYQVAAATPRVTITGTADFTAIKTDGTGRAVVNIYYIPA